MTHARTLRSRGHGIVVSSPMARSKRLLMVLHTMLESRRDSRRVHHRLNVYRLLQHPALIRYAVSLRLLFLLLLVRVLP